MLIINKAVMIDFNSIEALIDDVIDNKLPHIQFMVLPDWPCMAWYKRLHNEVKAGKALGMFAWERWLFALDG